MEIETEKLTAKYTAMFIDKDSNTFLYPRCQTCGTFLYFLCLMGIWFFHCSNCHESSGYIIQNN